MASKCALGQMSTNHHHLQVFDKGLCLTSNKFIDFSRRLSKLEGRSQIVEPNSVPLNADDPGQLLLEAYRDAPKLYPELKRYAAFSQGIRKIDISFDFVNFYRFFKVTTGGFHEQGDPCGTYTYEVFETMPHLNEVSCFEPFRAKICTLTV